MGSINDVITPLRQAPTNVDRGTRFEQLVVRYFRLAPALAQQYDEVCRWMDWPGRDSRRLLSAIKGTWPWSWPTPACAGRS